MGQRTYPFGYCTNVHAGTSLDQAKANLLEHAAAVRSQVIPDGQLPVGLWLAENAADALLDAQLLDEFRIWLDEHRFSCYTFNGFPQGDFHQPVVKHKVYEPTWACDSRARYTMCLAEILDVLLPDGTAGSISTLPLGWPHAPWHAENFKACADNLLDVAKYLDRLAQASGRQIVLAIEPEPGCVLNTAMEVVEFFEHYLFAGPDGGLAREYLSVCHDICHSGVMFESQVSALELYRHHGIRVGKVQVSSAVHVPWDECLSDAAQQAAVLGQLKLFNEPKYLHQTTRANHEGNLDKLAVDLSQALEQWVSDQQRPETAWRIHFHIPIFVKSMKSLLTTQRDITDATRYLEANREATVGASQWFTGHYEVETYAWPVLPPELAVNTLADGIARELQYFQSVLQVARSDTPAH